MASFTVILGISYILYLLYEKFLVKKARYNFKHIIHVNGTRGKSTVSRLIDAALREQGFAVLTKTTGTSPRIIHVDGHESEIIRCGKANIREQIKIMNLAINEMADILVIECMAIKPELQAICQNDILMADIGVITNARLDHQDEMGHDLDNIIRSLGATIPRNGILFTADGRAYKYFEKLGQAYNTNVFLANERSKVFEGIDFEENVSLACKVCEYLGVDRQIAITGMKRYRKDPGSLDMFKIVNKRKVKIVFINAFAANDPDSTLKIFKMLNIEDDKNFHQKILLINNRTDRLSRIIQYIDFIKNINQCFDQIWIFGGFKRLMHKKIIKAGIEPDKVILLDKIDYLNNIQKETLVFGVGNIDGYGKSIVEFFKREEEGYAR